MPDEERDKPVDWFKSLVVKGDFSDATLDGYFDTVQGWLRGDMGHLRKPIATRRLWSDIIRFSAFAMVALGIILPLPIIGPLPNGPSGLELGYLAVLLGGLIVLLDRVFNISNSWMRLTLAEMQMRQVRYRLDLEWAKQRPTLTSNNQAVEGPILVDLLRTGMDAGHEIMKTQRETWTNELRQAMEALKGRLDYDRIALDRLRTERQQDHTKPTMGAVNITIDKPLALKGPFVVAIEEEEKVRSDAVPNRTSVKNIPAGLTTISLEAVRQSDGKPFKYSIAEIITAGEAKAVTIAVT